MPEDYEDISADEIILEGEALEETPVPEPTPEVPAYVPPAPQVQAQSDEEQDYLNQFMNDPAGFRKQLLQEASDIALNQLRGQYDALMPMAHEQTLISALGNQEFAQAVRNDLKNVEPSQLRQLMQIPEMKNLITDAAKYRVGAARSGKGPQGAGTFAPDNGSDGNMIREIMRNTGKDEKAARAFLASAKEWAS